MVPLAIKRKPRLYLGMLFRMAADDSGRYPMIRSSVLYLSPDEDGSRLLLHYDYERDKADGYPEAHLQVSATSEAWALAPTHPILPAARGINSGGIPAHHGDLCMWERA